MDSEFNRISRRGFVRAVSLGGSALFVGVHQPLLAWQKAKQSAEQKGEEEVGPAEDLMREHGVLKRILLIYEEARRRISARQDFPPATIVDSAHIIRSFIEEYHERLEEDHLFPRFRKAGKLVELVDTLTTQHNVGRTVTTRILSLAQSPSLNKAEEREKLSQQLEAFIRMYSPHEAREDTVLFPELHKIISRNEYDSLGEQFERVEHQQFGEEGFEGMVERVAAIEKQLGIYDLAQFTPK